MKAAAPDHPNPAPAPGLDSGVAGRLPADAYYHLIRTLCPALPQPPGEKPGPDDLARRNHSAIARIAAFAPANAAEADLAAHYVAASEHWKNCLRLAELPETAPELAAKYNARALSMMRQAQSALRLLLRLQEAREKREADSVTCNRAAWSEHCAINLMAEALSPQRMPAAVVQPPAPPLAPELQSEPMQEAELELEPDPIAEAEQYATFYPERAALIRRLRRVPANPSFGPPDDDLVQVLITAHTPALAALDREYAQACPVPRHGARAV